MVDQSMYGSRIVSVCCAIKETPLPTNNQQQLNILNKLTGAFQDELKDPTVYFTAFPKQDINHELFEDHTYVHVQQVDIRTRNTDISLKEIEAIVMECVNILGFECTKVRSKEQDEYHIG